MNGRDAGAGRLIWMIAGFLVWSAAFAGLYAMLSIGCAFGWHETDLVAGLTLQRAVLIALFLLSVGAGAFILRVTVARRTATAGGPPLAIFVEWTAWLGAWAALAATIVSLGPVFFLTACY